MNATKIAVGKYWDLHIRPSLICSGVPSDGLRFLRQTYVKDAMENPKALIQIKRWWQNQYKVTE